MEPIGRYQTHSLKPRSCLVPFCVSDCIIYDCFAGNCVINIFARRNCMRSLGLRTPGRSWTLEIVASCSVQWSGTAFQALSDQAIVL